MKIFNPFRNGDGVSLLMAYGLNLDPNQNLAGNMPKPVFSDGQLSMTFYAGSEGVIYTVETSSDLKIWTPTGVTVSAPDAGKFRTATIPMSGPSRYLRLGLVSGEQWASASLVGKLLTYNHPDGWWRVSFAEGGAGENQTSDGEVETISYTYTVNANRAEISMHIGTWTEITSMIYTSKTEGTFVYRGYQSGIPVIDLTGSFLVTADDIAMNLEIPPPTVATGSVTGVTSVAATLAGTVNPNGSITTAQFEYGLTTSYGSTAETMLARTWVDRGEREATLSDLLPWQTYHYRLTAANSSAWVA